MLVSDFDFHLPPELIAQHPPAQRDGARMLTLDRATGALHDRTFRDLPSLLRPGDLLVLNDSRVIPARLFAVRSGQRTQKGSPRPSGKVEVLLTQQVGPDEWRALVKPARKVLPGEVLEFHSSSTESSQSQRSNEPLLSAEVLSSGEFGERLLRFSPCSDFFGTLERLGHIPLPPYLHRPDTPEDRARYQTVYAGAAAHGSAAAPTAGLHFTPAVLAQIQQRGVQIASVTLHVGLGTFQPVHVRRLDEIRLHEEHYTLPAETASALNAARQGGRRIVAAGTTTVRTLEHCAREARGEPVKPHRGSTSIFLSPGHRFEYVDALLTNFHLPQSTLLMLVCAFAGTDAVLRAYGHAVQQRYRFFSYGDCMFLS